MSLTSSHLSPYIDQLFEQYLGLLHQYDSLRNRLGILQGSTLQNISRANFSAPRGTRYGQDLYDARVTATRFLQTATDASNSPVFTLSPYPLPSVSSPQSSTPHVSQSQDAGKHHENPETTKSERKGEVKAPKDPLHMFGILAIPSSLRVAQHEAVDMLALVPELITIDVQMKEIEIQIRRARKHRVKAEVKAEAAEKSQAQTMEAGEEVVGVH